MRFHGAVLALVCIGLGLVWLLPAHGQQIHREGFEGADPLWVRGTADAPFKETVHKITDEHAHLGQHSEQIQVQAESGTYIYYYYDTPRTPIADDTVASIRLKSAKPGMTLQARVILPHERNPNNPQESLAITLQSEAYDLLGKWQRLQLRNPVKLLHEKQLQMQAESKRPNIDVTDAYIDRLLVNVYSGPGVTDVFIDDLEVGPALDKTPFRPTSRPVDPDPKIGDSQPLQVEFRDQLYVGGSRFFFRAIRHTDTPLNVLRDAGFNTVCLSESSPPELIEEAARLKLRVMADLPLFTPDEKQLVSAEALQQHIRYFTRPDNVLFWNLGRGGLTADEYGAVSRFVSNIESYDPRPVATDIWDGFKDYSSGKVKLVGAHRWPLMSSLELSGYRDWLQQRRTFTWPQTFMWTWIQDHLPEAYTSLVYDRSASKPFAEPIGPQPEQIRLMTYLALSAGCRGLGFWSDRFLAESHQGHDRMLELALVNQELQLLEPLLCSAPLAPSWIETSNPNVRAAVFRGERGTLVLPIWVGSGSQYVTGQGAAANLSITLPVPDSAEAWEVSPGEIRSLRIDRVMGGKKVTLNEFGLTAAIVFTSDNGPTGLLVYFQDKIRQMNETAAQWSMTLARKEMEKVLAVENELSQLGHTVKNENQLLANATERLEKCERHFADHEFRECYLESQRVMRPLRIVMRSQWEDAVKALPSPVTSPYSLCYYTLPRHWRFMDDVKKTVPGRNLLTNGDFEVPATEVLTGWSVQNPTPLDEVELTAQRVSEEHQEGKQCLKLEVRPKNPQQPPSALERTFLAIHSPDITAEPGSWVQISGWVRIPKPITASVDGAMLYESVGDSPLGLRLSSCPSWKQFVLYRKVPSSGKLRVSLALTGIGTAYFDDVRVEPCLPK